MFVIVYLISWTVLAAIINASLVSLAVCLPVSMSFPGFPSLLSSTTFYFPWLPSSPHTFPLQWLLSWFAVISYQMSRLILGVKNCASGYSKRNSFTKLIAISNFLLRINKKKNSYKCTYINLIHAHVPIYVNINSSFIRDICACVWILKNYIHTQILYFNVSISIYI